MILSDNHLKKYENKYKIQIELIIIIKQQQQMKIFYLKKNKFKYYNFYNY